MTDPAAHARLVEILRGEHPAVVANILAKVLASEGVLAVESISGGLRIEIARAAFEDIVGE